MWLFVVWFVIQAVTIDVDLLSVILLCVTSAFLCVSAVQMTKQPLPQRDAEKRRGDAEEGVYPGHGLTPLPFTADLAVAIHEV